jgi:hypothetical protein
MDKQIMENEMGGACTAHVSIEKSTERNLAVKLKVGKYLKGLGLCRRIGLKQSLKN